MSALKLLALSNKGFNPVSNWIHTGNWSNSVFEMHCVGDSGCGIVCPEL